MFEDQPKGLLYVALSLLGVTVLIHLIGGLSELYQVLTSDGIAGYTVLMLLGGALPLIVLSAMLSGMLQPSVTYLILSMMMVLYIATYADVHVFGMLESTIGVDLHTHDHSEHSHDSSTHNGDDHGHDHNGHDDDHAHDHNDHDSGHRHGHDDDGIGSVISHLQDDFVALAAKVSEGGAAVVFAILAIKTR